MKIHPTAILLTSAIALLSIFLDVALLRQIIGFVFLTFIPGFLILKVLKLRTEWIDTILLSAGLSIAFLMFMGLALNVLLPLLGFAAPLSLAPILVVLSCLVFGLLFVVYKKRQATNSLDVDHSTPWKTSAFVLIFLLFSVPVLSILGSVYNDTLIMLISLLLMALIGGLSWSSRIIPQRFHILIVFMVAIALIFQTSFISNHLMGFDVNVESYVFKSVLVDNHWSPSRLGVDSDIARFKSVLSVTILPAIYSLTLNIDSETLFKIVYPLFLSLTALVLYRVYEIQTKKSVAILAVLFLMFSTTFIGMEQLGLARQIVAELFLALSLFLLVNEAMPLRTRQVLFLVFGAPLVVSHYAVAYFYVFLIVVYFIASRKWRFRNLVNTETVLLLLAITFLWYLYVSDAPFLKAITDLNGIYNNFYPDLNNPVSRSAQVATLTTAPTSIASLFNRVVFLAQNLFVTVGIAGLLVKLRRKALNSAYYFMSVINFLVLVACLVVPNLAGTLNLSRFYVLTMLFLAPYFVIGGETIFNWLHDVLSKWILKASRTAVSSKSAVLQLVAAVLVISFLCNFGFIDHFTGNYPTSWSLDRTAKRNSSNPSIRVSYYDEIIPDQDVFSTLWLSHYMSQTRMVYADGTSIAHVLTSYGPVPAIQSSLIFAYSPTGQEDYVYLRYLNVIDGLGTGGGRYFNLTELEPALDFINKIYSNGESEIYSSVG
jgi:uncharacterized membrane protein